MFPVVTGPWETDQKEEGVISIQTNNERQNCRKDGEERTEREKTKKEGRREGGKKERETRMQITYGETMETDNVQIKMQMERMMAAAGV